MRIFLTGGTGFVGSNFINEAHSRGIKVIALRRPGALPRVPLMKQPIWVDGELDGDFTESLKGVDTFVHLASHTPNPPYDKLSICLYWNVFASLKLAEQAMHCGVKKYLIIGSCFEYGESANHYSVIPVNAPLLPSLSYPTSKAAASTAFLGFAAENTLKLQILRLFQVYGEGEQETRFWPSLKRAAKNGDDFSMSPGEQVRDFIHVKDVSRKIVEALNFEHVIPGEPLLKNIGSGKNQSLRDFAEACWKEWGGTGIIKFGEVSYRSHEYMRLVPDLHEGRMSKSRPSENTK